jgi:FKBP-type peptidyl-prolyl cis-trans isomerase
MNKILFIGLMVSFLVFDSCKDDADDCTKSVPSSALTDIDQTRLQSDIATIDNYLIANSIVAITEPKGVRYVITKMGTGATPCLQSKINVKTSGRLLIGNEFQEETTFTTKLSGLIMGWQLVLPLIPAGSTLTLYIPSGYGYGVGGGAGGKIPSNANLIFDIELISVN